MAQARVASERFLCTFVMALVFFVPFRRFFFGTYQQRYEHLHGHFHLLLAFSSSNYLFLLF